MASMEKSTFITLIVLNALSIILCLFAIVIYIIAKPLRNYAFKLVFWMNLADLLRSISQIIPKFYRQSYEICQILGFFHVFSSIFSLYWALVIAITIYQVLVKQILDVEKYYKYWFGFSLSISSICGIIPIFLNDISYLHEKCTINESFKGMITKFSEFYIPAFIITIINTVIFYKVYIVLKEEDEVIISKDKNDAKRLFYYPIILVIAIIPSMIENILSFFNFESGDLEFISELTWALQCILNSACYTLTKPIKAYISSICKNKKSFLFEGSELNNESITLENFL
ncbi:hypothetical protein SteCoe_13580 [Stentor coeruleus]|uniref:G-protein coupled receptors family 1 profile domain-containing protein n=1 Tax=Stentor coeruleus TaxID=5963 RepID=A0A1R2C8B1_9CILI|nr:hypothetical protein SteCoe_13580 [Stentor coeruleus]